MSATKTVVVTGASGALGQRTSRDLAAHGHRVIGICLNPDGRQDIHTADLSVAVESWMRLFANADVVIHLAGNPIPRIDWQSAQGNVAITRNVLEASRRYGVKRVIYASSNWVMAGHRFSSGAITPDMPVHPLTPYGLAKYIGEEIGRSFAMAGFFEFVALRIGYLPADGRSGPHLFYGAWGQQMWLAPDDFCDAIRQAALVPLVERFSVVNLMSDNEGSRWSLAATKERLAFVSTRGVAPQIRLIHRVKANVAHLTYAVGEWLCRFWIRHRW